MEWYDYGARFYDAQVGRFHSVDPIIEKFPHLTPFNYASNNPVSNIDLWGLQGMNFNLMANFSIASIRVKNWIGGLVSYTQKTYKNNEYKSMNNNWAKVEGLESQKKFIDLIELSQPLIDETDIRIGASLDIKVDKDTDASIGIGAEFGTDGARVFAEGASITGEISIDENLNSDFSIKAFDQNIIGDGSKDDGKNAIKTPGKIYFKIITDTEAISKKYTNSKEIRSILKSYKDFNFENK